MVLVLAKIFRFVVLAKLLHLKNEKLINVELKTSLLKTEEASDYFSLVAKVKTRCCTGCYLRNKSLCLGLSPPRVRKSP